MLQPKNAQLLLGFVFLLKEGAYFLFLYMIFLVFSTTTNIVALADVKTVLHHKLLPLKCYFVSFVSLLQHICNPASRKLILLIKILITLCTLYVLHT